jgi:hypothetical protein
VQTATDLSLCRRACHVSLRCIRKGKGGNSSHLHSRADRQAESTAIRPLESLSDGQPRYV